jgi:hypothetical protein
MNSNSTRVISGPGQLWSRPRISAKRRRCEWELPGSHWIEVGQPIVWCAVPPNHPDLGNTRWLHAGLCLDCAPAAALIEGQS